MTQSPSTATGSEAAAVSSGRTGTGSTPARLADDTGQGKTTIASGVVQKISGIAARDVSGVYSMGGGVSRAFGAIRERIPGGSGTSQAAGVQVEVGEKQAAIDLDIVVEYGAGIVELARAVRRGSGVLTRRGRWAATAPAAPGRRRCRRPACGCR